MTENKSSSNHDLESNSLEYLSPSTSASFLDGKINEHFSGLVVRKDLVKAVKGNAVVPTYVLEYLLAQFAASDSESVIQAGIERVREILARHYVHRNQAELIKSRIREAGIYKIIDRVTVTFNDRADVYEASFANLGISGVEIDPSTVKANQKLLVGGVWCLCDLEYWHSQDNRTSPWKLASLKPIQMSSFDFSHYLLARSSFSTDEWIDLLVQSIGFDPEKMGRRAKLHQLVRLVPYAERNFNLIELGPKGTGKSHVYSEFSPHGILISGSEVTVPKLFVNNTTGRIGLVGYWDVVAFDEFAGHKKRPDGALVDIMKNYMANKSFSRGIEPYGAEASMVFVGNTAHTVPYMLKHSDLFDELPQNYHDSAFLDRLHFYIPGWEIDTIRSEMFSTGFGFVVDYFAEILKSMRNLDYSDRYAPRFTLSSGLSTRDRDAVHKTFSGMYKLLFPHEEATDDEIEELLRFSIEGRKRVKDQIVRIDPTMSKADFSYEDSQGRNVKVKTLEEEEYPAHYYGHRLTEAQDKDDGFNNDAERGVPFAELPQGQHDFEENQRGVSFTTLLIPYLQGAVTIELHDPYIRAPHQGRNLVELLAALAVAKDPADEISFNLFTTLEEDPDKRSRQWRMLNEIIEASEKQGIIVKIIENPAGHDRWIRGDNGWRINLGRGLDIFQKFDGSWFDFETAHQGFRKVKEFGVTYIREDGHP